MTIFLKDTREIMQISQSLDDLLATQKAMKAFQVPDYVLETQKAIKMVQVPDYVFEIQKTMKMLQVPDYVLETQKTMKAFQVPDYVFETQKVMKAFQVPDYVLEAQKALKAFQIPDYIREAQSVMKVLQIPDHLLEAQKVMMALQIPDHFKEAQIALKSLRMDSIINALSQDRWPLAYEADISDLMINNDNTISLGSKALSYAEIQEIVNQITDKAFNKAAKDFEQTLTSIIAEIRALKNPALEKILTWLVFPIIVGLIYSIINPITDYYIKAYLASDKRYTEKQIKKHAIRSVEDVAQLKFYRLVIREVISVRSKPLTKSPVFRKLYFGQPVILLAKKKNWALITWSDEGNDLMLQGWVLSKYLSKFK
jgi:hypothetical protein